MSKKSLYQFNDPVEEWLHQVNEKESAGELTFKEAPINEYLQLLSDSEMPGCHIGRVVIKPHRFAQIDNEDITWFADTLTWIKVKDIQNCKVVRVRSKFNEGQE